MQRSIPSGSTVPERNLQSKLQIFFIWIAKPAQASQEDEENDEDQEVVHAFDGHVSKQDVLRTRKAGESEVRNESREGDLGEKYYC